MVTQLLFGEHFQLLDSKGSWQLIRISYDGYECWIDKKQFHAVKQIKGISDTNTALTTDLLQLAEDEKSGTIPLILGSSLPKFNKKSFVLGKQKLSFDGDTCFPFAKKKEHSIVEVAKWYLNTPYLWGGRSPFGIDCSGFTQMVYKLNGIKLLRDAWQQAEQGKALSFLEEATAGDLAFFDNEEGKIVHVGIILDRGKIIHASGKVRIDKLDHQGIYNEDMKKYTHRLRVAKKY